jgi:hypothetical protein
MMGGGRILRVGTMVVEFVPDEMMTFQTGITVVVSGGMNMVVVSVTDT